MIITIITNWQKILKSYSVSTTLLKIKLENLVWCRKIQTIRHFENDKETEVEICPVITGIFVTGG